MKTTRNLFFSLSLVMPLGLVAMESQKPNQKKVEDIEHQPAAAWELPSWVPRSAWFWAPVGVAGTAAVAYKASSTVKDSADEYAASALDSAKANPKFVGGIAAAVAALGAAGLYWLNTNETAVREGDKKDMNSTEDANGAAQDRANPLANAPVWYQELVRLLTEYSVEQKMTTEQASAFLVPICAQAKKEKSAYNLLDNKELVSKLDKVAKTILVNIVYASEANVLLDSVRLIVGDEVYGKITLKAEDFRKLLANPSFIVIDVRFNLDLEQKRALTALADLKQGKDAEIAEFIMTHKLNVQ